MRHIRRLLAAMIIVSLAMVGLAPTTAQAAATTRYDGALPNGATWIADVPANWNGTLLLYSHGYNPTPDNPPVNSPGPAVADALLARGYALAGSSYSRSGWVTDTAASDGLDTLRAVTALIGRPRRAIALGTSFGGMVTGQLAERGGRQLDGAIATCGLMGGGIDLHNYQLDGSHALAQLLLAGGEQVKLVRFTDTAEAFATAGRMVAALDQAQASPEGRARIALITALYQEPAWVPGQPKPAPGDIEAQVAGQYQNLRTILPFIVAGRFDMERSAGGNPSWNKGVDYGRQLAASGRLAEVAQMYRQAGIDLRADLKVLTRTATVTADREAYRWMRNSTLTGRLAMPVLTLHTTDDGLVPVQHVEEYADDVHGSHSAALLRQAYADHAGHCAFTTAELIAAVFTMEMRIQTGRWDGLAEPHRMQALADSLGLDSAAFIRYRVPEFLGDRPAPPRLR